MSIFLTGATGFIGRRLVERLLADGTDEIRCLVVDPTRLAAHPRLIAVPGALPDSLEGVAEALHGCDAVVHLAGSTGRAPAAHHLRVHRDGTAALVAAARQAGVPRFVYVSTIAVTYPEKTDYPYARAKEAAERNVRESGLDWAILRPTIVLGPGSPIAKQLAAMAGAPVLPLLGGGRSRIQPVHVEDVAAALAGLARERSLEGRTIDFGGRDQVTFAEFLTRLRLRLLGRDGPCLRIPLGPIVGTLARLERVGLESLPLNAGQFYAFRHDGAARDDPRAEPPRAARRGVDDLLEEIQAELLAPPTQSEIRRRLEEECATFARYLSSREPDELVRRHYLRAHEPGRCGPVDPAAPEDPLVAFARRSPLRARLADTWAALFDRRGALRRKLVLMLAMLESMADTSRCVDGPTTRGVVEFALGAALRVGAFALTLPVAALVLGPRWWRARRRGGRE